MSEAAELECATSSMEPGDHNGDGGKDGALPSALTTLADATTSSEDKIPEAHQRSTPATTDTSSSIPKASPLSKAKRSKNRIKDAMSRDKKNDGKFTPAFRPATDHNTPSLKDGSETVGESDMDATHKVGHNGPFATSTVGPIAADQARNTHDPPTGSPADEDTARGCGGIVVGDASAALLAGRETGDARSGGASEVASAEAGNDAGSVDADDQEKRVRKAQKRRNQKNAKKEAEREDARQRAERERAEERKRASDDLIASLRKAQNDALERVQADAESLVALQELIRGAAQESWETPIKRVHADTNAIRFGVSNAYTDGCKMIGYVYHLGHIPDVASYQESLRHMKTWAQRDCGYLPPGRHNEWDFHTKFNTLDILDSLDLVKQHLILTLNFASSAAAWLLHSARLNVVLNSKLASLQKPIVELERPPQILTWIRVLWKFLVEYMNPIFDDAEVKKGLEIRRGVHVGMEYLHVAAANLIKVQKEILQAPPAEWADVMANPETTRLGQRLVDAYIGGVDAFHQPEVTLHDPTTRQPWHRRTLIKKALSCEACTTTQPGKLPPGTFGAWDLAEFNETGSLTSNSILHKHLSAACDFWLSAWYLCLYVLRLNINLNRSLSDEPAEIELGYSQAVRGMIGEIQHFERTRLSSLGNESIGGERTGQGGTGQSGGAPEHKGHDSEDGSVGQNDDKQPGETAEENVR